MDEIIKFWDIIVKSNTFNFAILLLIFAIVANKLKIGKKIEQLKLDIVKSIEDAQLKKEESAKVLSQARFEVENLDKEVSERIKNTKNNAETISEEILKNAGQKVQKYESGVSRTIEAEEKTISATLSKQAATAAVELAKLHIKRTLDNNRELHRKFINDSIEELDRINI